MGNKPKEKLDIIWLRAFVLTAECQKFTAVAAELGCAQTGVRRYIDNLEAWAGRELVDKQVPPQLTGSGRYLLPLAKDILRLLDNAKADVCAGAVPDGEDPSTAGLAISFIEVLEGQSP